jgi:hypothetical protein
MMKMWVFRVPTGAGGDPMGRVCAPNELNPSEMDAGAVNSEDYCEINYDNCLEFVLSELFQKGNLRQGWGIPTLDLRLPENVWVGKYILAAKKYWNSEVACDAARGRRDIISRMLSIRPEDIIFLPKVTKQGESKANFTVVTAAGNYFFEDRSQAEQKDFAHVIKVKKVRTYPYPTGQIGNAIFGAPFMTAIDPVEQYYANNVYERLAEFVDTTYRT